VDRKSTTRGKSARAGARPGFDAASFGCAARRAAPAWAAGAALRATLVWLGVALLVAGGAPPSSAALPDDGAGIPLALTWELATDADAEALATLSARDVPATWFVTGAFAEAHPELVRALPGTVGSLGYDYRDLSTLEEAALHREMQLGKLVLEDVRGSAVTWFRAPMLAGSDAVLREAAGLGFTADSSEPERWGQQLRMIELPVSVADGAGALVSDHDLFEVRGLDDDRALEWLEARLRERTATGRSLVLALAPRRWAGRESLFERFLARARAAGFEPISAQTWLARATAAPSRRLGVWVDLSQHPHDPTTLRRDVEAAGITDVYLQVRDPDGMRYWPYPAVPAPPPADRIGPIIEALADTDVRIHLWLPVLRDPLQASRHPGDAMVGRDGTVSREWLSPTATRVHAELVDTVGELVRRYRPDGLHLDYLRYPDLDHDFAVDVVDTFRREHRADDISVDAMFDEFYNDWVEERAERIAALTEALALAARHTSAGIGRSSIEVSAALYADAATRYRVMETMGQDYARLARHLDTVVPMAYLGEQRRSPAWIPLVAAATFYRAGARQRLVGLESYQRPPEVEWSADTFRGALELASRGWQGRVFYAYGYLFGRGPAAANLPPQALAMVTGAAGAGDLPPAVGATAVSAVEASSEAAAAGRGLGWMPYAAVLALFGLAGLAAAAGRRRRST
jgi:hypothetical protein